MFKALKKLLKNIFSSKPQPGDLDYEKELYETKLQIEKEKRIWIDQLVTAISSNLDLAYTESTPINRQDIERFKEHSNKAIILENYYPITCKAFYRKHGYKMEIDNTIKKFHIEGNWTGDKDYRCTVTEVPMKPKVIY